MKLLARPLPALFESWPGYLHRLAHQNRMNGVQGIADLLGLLPYRLLVSSPRDILKDLGIKLPSDEGSVLDMPSEPAGRVYLARAGRSFRTRICPECVRKDRGIPIPSEWDAALSFTCSRHHVALLDVCPACAATLTYERNDLFKCRCGYSLWMAKTNQTAVAVEQVLRILDLSTYGTLRPTFAPSTKQEILAAWLVRRLSIADEGQFQIRKAARMKGDAFVTAAQVQAVSPWFTDWPNGFIARLADIKARHHVVSAKIFGMGPSGFAGELPAIADAIAEFDRRRRTGKRPTSATSTATIEKSWMGIKQLMIQTGCCYYAIQNWIRFGWLGDVRTERRARGDTLYFIDKRMALHAISMVKRTAAISNIASEIGLERTALRSLVQAGVLKSIPFGTASWNVRVIPSEVFELARSLLGVAVRGKPSSAETISISTALRRLRKRNPLLITAFIGAILTGKLRTRKFIQSPVTLDEISLREDEFAYWLRVRKD